ncbi:hypothetical protein BC938DRAFT_476272 [Jimgerdemannia flammicorona]|uniref:Uncharacterized protein n=1 Tax=Jimgerdemannia flammicorona TaxID=994334 RepID=A0A433QQP3_9FUNG|nr:hypothetical protein BC938DRAFT_476272 [Jimgerdemannia flammicorona]
MDPFPYLQAPVDRAARRLFRIRLIFHPDALPTLRVFFRCDVGCDATFSGLFRGGVDVQYMKGWDRASKRL